ncbi:MAG: RNA pseudouridine synthase [Bacteroidales bacterium]|nr:RNA pseudouridine synthase [Bacteroidales bacterium]MCF8343827.1 RNA pseudouridine synthase [Bacteroidales bacterium]MCF8377124.1 RNA pseudouridine synthase [Bacteroidales bacterium]MCF8401030.1 RNA pseudouridine synthase [Bacteroidales bacterium]
MKSQVLHEDNHLIIVNKQPSQIVQGDKTGDVPLVDLVKKYLKEKYNKPGEVFCGVVHRLDRPVSGLVVFARTSKALARMNDLVKTREIRKTYWAVVKNRPPDFEGHLTNYLVKNQQKNKSFVTDENAKGALRAEMKYRMVAKSNDYLLLEVDLLTGRHHQIRVQLAHIGCPVKGDLKYGFPRSNPAGSIHLHARKISFIHPVKKTELTITAPAPPDKLWTFFEQSV